MTTLSATMEVPGGKPKMTQPTAEPTPADQQLTRREFMTYAWGIAVGALTLEMGAASYFFMAPRFRVGEFGGKFFLAETAIPSSTTAPAGYYMNGKFWLVNTADGPKALYMVCTHLGCLYKWEESKQRFECPCHGSKFSYDGYYIEGPAPRSLDTFAVTQVDGQLVVDTGKKTLGERSADSPVFHQTA